MPEQSEINKPPVKKFSRRKFLKIAALGSAAAVLTSGQVEKMAIDWIFGILTTPQEGENILTKAARLLGNEKENPNFRQMNQIIAEGISSYERQTGQKARYTKSSDYKDFSYYQEGLNKIKNSIGILAQDPRKLVAPLIDSFPPLAKREYIAAEADFGDFLTVMSKGSGMYARYGGAPITNDKSIELKRQKTKEYLTEARKFVEEKVKDNQGKPISASHLFTFFLKQNQGNISQSLTDTYLFLKFASRNDFETGKFTANDKNISWMQEKILDEYGIKPFNSNTQSSKSDLINLVGKPYHSWNLVAMLPYFPPEVIEIAGIYRQVTHISQQGADKLNSDLLTLGNLKTTEDLLKKFQQ